MNYAKHTRTLPEKTQQRAPLTVPATKPLPGQVKNSTNVGYAWAVTDWQRLDRFLILGSEGGTFYAGERDLTINNSAAVRRCIAEDGERVIKTLVEISVSGRAPRNDEAIFVLVLCACAEHEKTRQKAMAALPKVVRTNAHMLQFVSTVDGFRGWGKLLRTATKRWFNDKPADQLAYQFIKYQQRGDWSTRDVLRLVKPLPRTAAHSRAYQWSTTGWTEVTIDPPTDGTKLIWVYEQSKRAKSESDIINLIQAHRLTVLEPAASRSDFNPSG